MNVCRQSINIFKFWPQIDSSIITACFDPSSNKQLNECNCLFYFFFTVCLGHTKDPDKPQ